MVVWLEVVSDAYYIDGLDVPFHSICEISEFIINLPTPYQLMDRHVYYGNVISNRFYHCLALDVKFLEGLQSGIISVSFLLARDDFVYCSFSPCFMNRSFVRI